MTISEIDNGGTTSGSRNADPGLLVRMWRAIFDTEGQTRAVLAEHPAEARLLMFVLLSDLIYALSWTLKTLVSPEAAEIGHMGTDGVLWLVVALLMRTALIYTMAAVIGWSMRLAGMPASMQETRTAVFWGGLVAAVPGLVLSQIAVFTGTQPPFGTLIYLAGFAVFVWFIAKAVAAANNLKNHLALFAAFSLAAFVLALGIRALAG